MFSKEVIESIKQFIRIALSGAVSYLLTEGVLHTIVRVTLGSRIDPTLIIIITGLGTSILSGLDKLNHENGNKSPLDMKGGILDDLKGKK